MSGDDANRWPLRDKRAYLAFVLRAKLSPSPGIPANVLAVAAADLCLLWLNGNERKDGDEPEADRYMGSHYAKMATVVAVSLGQHRLQQDGTIPKPEHLHLPSLTIKPGSKRPGIDAVREARRWLIDRGVVEFEKTEKGHWLVTYIFDKLDALPDVFNAYERTAPDARPRCQHCNKLVKAARTTKKYCSKSCQDKAYRARVRDGKSEVAEPAIRDGKSEVYATVNPTSCDGKSSTNSTNVLNLGTATPIQQRASAPTALRAELASGTPPGEELAGAGRAPAGADLPAESVPATAAEQLPAEDRLMYVELLARAARQRAKRGAVDFESARDDIEAELRARIGQAPWKRYGHSIELLKLWLEDSQPEPAAARRRIVRRRDDQDVESAGVGVVAAEEDVA